MDESSRRQFLGLCGIAGTAGCLRLDEGGENATDATPGEAGETIEPTAEKRSDPSQAEFLFEYDTSDRRVLIRFTGGTALVAGEVEIRTADGKQVTWAELGSTATGTDERLDVGATAGLGPTVLNWGEPVGKSAEIRLVYTGGETPATLGRFEPSAPTTLTSTVPDRTSSEPTSTVPDRTPSEPTVTVETPRETDTAVPSISAFDLTNPSGRRLRVSFDTTGRLTDIEVDIDGPETVTLGMDAFTETETRNGGYRYEAAVEVSANGDYTARLRTAEDTDGLDVAGGQSARLSLVSTASPISAFSLSEQGGQDLRVSFESTERLSTIEVDLDGPDPTTLGTDDFTIVEVRQDYVTYRAKVPVASAGDYTARLRTAENEDGLDVANGQSARLSVAGETPTISAFSVAAPSTSQEIRVSFESTERLSTIEVGISGPETTTLGTDDFTATTRGSRVTYEATALVGSDGEYTAQLRTAADADGLDGASDQSVSVSLDTTPPKITRFRLRSVEGSELQVVLESSERLSRIDVSLDGTAAITLSASDFSATQVTDGHSYTATVSPASGSYTATLDTAVDEAGNDGASGQTASASLVQVTEEWTFQIDGQVSASPAVAGDAVFVPSGESALYGVDGASGEQRWAVETEAAVETSPAVAGGLVFVGTPDNALRALDAESGEGVWEIETEGKAHSPTVTDGLVFVGSSEGAFYAVDAESGEERWAAETEGAVTEPPAVTEEMVYAGTGENLLYAWEAATGILRWIDDTDGSVTAPTAANGTVYVGSSDGRLRAIRGDTREVRWTVEADSAVHSPATSGDTVIASSAEGTVFAVDAESGDRRWTYETDGQIGDGPTVNTDLVVVGSGNVVYALSET